MSRLQHFSIAYTDVWGFHISFFPLQNGQKNKYPSICPRILLICFNESCRVCSFNWENQTWYLEKKVAIFNWEWGQNSAPRDWQKIPCWGEVKRSNIIKFQLPCQFQVFLYQTLCVFSQIKESVSNRFFILLLGSCPRGGTLGCWWSKTLAWGFAMAPHRLRILVTLVSKER